jgi:hypothetical protein
MQIEPKVFSIARLGQSLVGMSVNGQHPALKPKDEKLT